VWRFTTGDLVRVEVRVAAGEGESRRRLSIGVLEEVSFQSGKGRCISGNLVGGLGRRGGFIFENFTESFILATNKRKGVLGGLWVCRREFVGSSGPSSSRKYEAGYYRISLLCTGR